MLQALFHHGSVGENVEGSHRSQNRRHVVGICGDHGIKVAVGHTADGDGMPTDQHGCGLQKRPGGCFFD